MKKRNDHKCRSLIIGSGESVDYILETDKGAIHKADSRVHQGIFFDYAWRSIECLIGIREGVYKCRTIRRRAEEDAYDPDCTDYLNIFYDDYVMKGAKTAPAAGTARPGAPTGIGPVPTRGR